MKCLLLRTDIYSVFLKDKSVCLYTGAHAVSVFPTTGFPPKLCKSCFIFTYNVTEWRELPPSVLCNMWHVRSSCRIMPRLGRAHGVDGRDTRVLDISGVSTRPYAAVYHIPLYTTLL